MKPRPKNRYGAVIDATELLESDDLNAYDFGEVDIEEVQICEMGVKEVDGEIRYKSIGGFSLVSGEEQSHDVVIGDLNDRWPRDAEQIDVDVLERDVRVTLDKWESGLICALRMFLRYRHGWASDLQSGDRQADRARIVRLYSRGE